jgi:hypothetical protein
LPLSHNDVITKNFSAIYGKKNLEATSYAFTLSKSSCRFSRPHLTAVPGFFGWESLNGWDLTRSQLVVASGLFRWESLDGWDFLSHNLLLFQTSFGGNPLMDGIF